MSRKRSATAWVRILHRWISMAFVIVAGTLIVQGVVGVDTTTSPFGLLALAMLVLLAVSGAWTAVHHYAVKLRHGGRRRVPVQGI
ncbi:MAG: hypothetical protein WA971_06855 [Microbacterium sp.]